MPTEADESLLMGWQGEVRKQSELDRIAAHFGIGKSGIVRESLRVWCWKSDEHYWINYLGSTEVLRVKRDTLALDPLPRPRPYPTITIRSVRK